MSEEINITEAQKLWQERLANECTYRIASGCDYDMDYHNQCNIKYCPLLYKAKLERVYRFRDLGKRSNKDD